MELLYIDNFIDKGQYESEYYHFILNYLIGDKIHIHSNFGLYLYGTINANKLTNNELFDFHENYWVHEKGDSEEVLKGIFKVKDRYNEYNKYIKTIKAKKHLKNADIALINSQKKLLELAKENVFYVYKTILEERHILPYIDLINDDVFNISFTLYDRKNIQLDEYVGELIYTNISTKENLFVVGKMFDKQMKLFCEAETEEAIEDGSSLITLESILLFTIPCSPKLLKDNLVILRKHFQIKIDALFSKIREMKIGFIDITLDDMTNTKFIEFEFLIKQDLIDIQNDIDKHVYFQNIKNSDSNFQNVNVYLGIIPPDLLLMVYGGIGVITINKMIELRNRTANSKGKRSVEIYLKYLIDSEDEE